MLQISQYDFSDNPNLPRILDSAKRDYGVDLELDFTIEQVGDCLRLIGKRAKEWWKVHLHLKMELSN